MTENLFFLHVFSQCLYLKSPSVKQKNNNKRKEVISNFMVEVGIKHWILRLRKFVFIIYAYTPPHTHTHIYIYIYMIDNAVYYIYK